MRCRVSFASVLTVLTLCLSLVPAVVIWVLLMDLRTASVSLLEGTTESSMEAMANTIQRLLMNQALDKFEGLLAQGDRASSELVALVRGSGLLQCDLHPARFDFQRQALGRLYSPPFNVMLANPAFSEVSLVGALWNGTEAHPRPAFWVTWVTLNVDALHNTVGTATLYGSTLAMAPGEAWTTMNVSYVDQVTAQPLALLSSQKAPSSSFVFDKYPDIGWLKTMFWNKYTGQLELVSERWLPALNDTYMMVEIRIGTWTLSDELRNQLQEFPFDRLVLFTRGEVGHMMAASHGKYFSHSDVDRRYINPLTNPPNLSLYSAWNCTRSTDLIIQQACQRLINEYHNWSDIPELVQEMVLGGQRYWVATAISTVSVPCTVLMLKNRASVMGVIDDSQAQVEGSVASKKGTTFTILGVVSAVAVVLPLAVGVWLASRLHTLAAAMDRIAQLQFTASAPAPTMFRELHRFQSSFTQMERGLEAFAKFVPQAVVKVLMSGQMQASNEMLPETLTVMFADIEGFSTICELESPATLVAVCTEYFEAMCRDIVQQKGTIDKFIGDCIMAMWNAPDPVPRHEREAVAAALAMQGSVMELHTKWRVHGLPVLKFRLGMHTGICLLGNFGCSYRVSYTCLGDGVNLSARLEALNKKFGSSICVSQATCEGCHGEFLFRRLGKVTVPGKAEVLAVYEVLCKAEVDAPSTQLCAAKDIPGAVNSKDLCCGSGGDGLGESSSAGWYRGDSTAAGAPVSSVLGDSRPGCVPYRWAYVDPQALLQHAQEYELAYAALEAGDHAEARQRLAGPPRLGPDRAWAALTERLEQCEAGVPWDGVFRFREK